MAKVVLRTNMGDITLLLDEEKTPKTTQNFISYVEEGFYDNTIFHRVIDGFMIQGGGFIDGMQQKNHRGSIENEANLGLENKKGTIAMARTSDPHSASSQFFINVADNDFLNFKSESVDGWGYCAFGEVVEGLDVVLDISHVNTVNRAGHQDVPERTVVIEKAELIKEVSTVES